MIDIRARSRIPDEEMAEKVGKIVTADDYNVLITGAATIRKPDGGLLGVYLPGALRDEFAQTYDTLKQIRGKTDNRGLASGSARARSPTGSRTRAKEVESAILGAFDPSGRKTYCRLTAYTAKHLDDWDSLRPLLSRVSDLFAERVPGRFKAQADYARRTPPEWMVPGTVFTTITVNNTYPTGVHTDKGDLDEGFSCLAVCRRGNYLGGVLTWPQYRIGVDLQDGDLLLTDAHEWHGNSRITCECGLVADGRCADCGAERISVVCYYRTNMVECGSMEEEDQRRFAVAESRMAQVGE